MVVIMGMSVLLWNDRTWHEFLGLRSDQLRHPRLCIGGQ